MSEDPSPRVVAHPDLHDVVLPTGLFPHNQFSHRVLVEDDRSPTGHKIRSLTSSELADQWDVPFLLQVFALKVEGGTERIKQLSQSPPAKVILFGSNSLLANHFWGSAAGEVLACTEAAWPKRRRTQVPDYASNKAPKFTLDLDNVTLGTEACTLEGHAGLGLEDPDIRCWLTEDDDV